MKRIDLTGKRFGRLIARSPVGLKFKCVLWECLCDCGNVCKVTSGQLNSGHTRSCGCLSSDVTAMRNTKHGLAKTSEWTVWVGMNSRCNCPTQPAFKDYGGRGIKVCRRWRDFTQFLADMGARPSPKHTLDRLRNNLGYSPKNCRWATRKQQSRNTRASRMVSMRGVKKCVSEWAEEIGIDKRTVYARIYNGWSEKEALLTPLIPGKHTKPIAV